MSEEQPFAASVEYQNKVLSLMLHHPQFCELCSSAISPTDFSNKIQQWFFSRLAFAPITLTPTTLREELLKAAKNKEIEAEAVPKYVELFEFILSQPSPYDEEYVLNHMQNFVRTQEVKKAIVDSVDLIKDQQWDVIYSRIEKAVTAGVDILSQGIDYFKEYQDRIANRVHREVDKKLGTGIPELDAMTFGGLSTKQLGLIVGGTGRGKSIFLQWLAKVAVMLNKKVVYITLELSAEDTADRFDAMFARIKPNALKDHSSEALKRLSKLHTSCGSSLFIKEYAEDEATVTDIKAYLLQLSANNFVPDLVLVDYVDLIKPHRIYNDTTQEQATVIQALRGVAKSLNTRIWTAAQLNRGGLAMETPDETSVSGAIAKIFTADIALFMAQTAEEREDQLMRIWVSKNRNGIAGRVIKIDTEYEFMTFFRPPVQIDNNEDTNEQRDNNNEETTHVSVDDQEDVCVL